MQREPSKTPKQMTSEQLKKKELWRKFKEQFKADVKAAQKRGELPEKK